MAVSEADTARQLGLTPINSEAAVAQQLGLKPISGGDYSMGTPVPASETPPPATRGTEDEGMSRGGRYALATAAEGIGGTLAALPGLAALAQGAYGAVMEREPDEGFGEAFGREMLYNDAGEVRGTVNAMQSGMQSGYDAAGWMARLLGGEYERDITAEEGQPGYLPADEELFGAVASAVVPVGWIGKAGKASQLGMKASTALAGMPKLAQTGAKVGSKAVELSMPGSVGGAGNIAANAGIQGLITEAGRGFSGQDTVTGVFEPSDPEQTRQVATEAAASTTPLPGYGMADMTRGTSDQPDDTSPTDAAAKTVGLGLAATGAVAALGALRGKVRAPDFVTNNLRDAEQAFDDDTARIARSVGDVAGEDEARSMQAEVDKNIGTSSDHHVTNMKMLGVLDPDGSVTTKFPVRAIQQAFDGLDKASQDKINNALRSIRIVQRWDDMNPTAAQQATYGSTVSTMRRQYHAALNDPVTGPLLKAHKEYHNDVARMRLHRGIIDQNQYNYETRPGYHYSPTQYEKEGFESGTELTRGIRRTMINTQNRDNKRWLSVFETRRDRAPNIQGGVVQRRTPNDTELQTLFNAKAVPAMELLDKYSESVLRGALENSTRISYIDRMRATPQGKAQIRKMSHGNDRTRGRAVHVRRNGLDEWYDVTDADVYTALQFRPHVFMPGPNTMRKVTQSMATGNWNPAFAPFSLLYDATMGALTMDVRKGYSGSADAMLDNVLNRASITPESRVRARQMLAGAARLYDVPEAVIVGLKRGAQGHMAHIAAINAVKRLGKDITNPQRVADVQAATQRFYDTAYGQLVGEGYASSRFDSDPLTGEAAFKWIDRHADKLKRSKESNAVLRGYDGTLSTIRESYRLGLFTRNVAAREAQLGRGLTPQELSEVASFVRHAAGDMSKTGGNAGWTSFLSMTPYGNITTRSLVHLMKAAANPATYSTLTAMMGIAAYNRELINDVLGPEALTEWYLKTPEYEQVASIPILWIDGTIKAMPIGIELGAVTYAMSNLYRKFFEDPSVLEETTRGGGVFGSFGGAAQRLFNLSTPTVVDAAYAALKGSRVRLGNLVQGENPFTTPLRNQGQTQADDRVYGGDSGIMTDRLAAVLSALLGPVGSVFSDGIEIGIDQRQTTKYDENFFGALAESASLLPGAAKTMAEDYGYNTASRYSGVWNLAVDAAGKVAPSVPLGKVVPTQSRFTPRTQRVYELDNAMQTIKDTYMQHVHGGTGRSTNPYPIGIQLDELAAMPAALPPGHPLGEQMQDVASYFAMQQRSDHIAMINSYKRQFEQYDASAKGTRNERAEKMNALNDKIQQEYDMLLQNYGEFEAVMQRRYGEDWSIESMADEIEDALGSQRQLTR